MVGFRSEDIIIKISDKQRHEAYRIALSRGFDNLNSFALDLLLQELEKEKIKCKVNKGAYIP